MGRSQRHRSAIRRGHALVAAGVCVRAFPARVWFGFGLATTTHARRALLALSFLTTGPSSTLALAVAVAVAVAAQAP